MSSPGRVVNNCHDIVQESLASFCALHSHLVHLIDAGVVFSPFSSARVSLISGGGSGHEPAHAGFIGDGMLAAAVCGAIFTSPSVDSILSAIIAASRSPHGCLLIVKNYQGDLINFGLAAEAARLQNIQTEIVVVADDIALPLPSSADEQNRRRGVAGTVFVHKIAGQAAASGMYLPQIASIARSVANNVRSLGFALSPCTLLSTGKPGFELPEGEMEMGVGIHGEKGVARRPAGTANEIVDDLVDRLVVEELWKGMERKRVALLVNNLGSLTGLEISIAAGRAFKQLSEKYGFEIERVIVGPLMTALDMRGLSLSLLNLELSSSECGLSAEQVLSFLDAPTEAPGWIRPSIPRSSSSSPSPQSLHIASPASQLNSVISDPMWASELWKQHSAFIISTTQTLCQRIITHSAELNALDAVVGDGDCGSTIERGCTSVVSLLESIPPQGLCSFFSSVGDTLRKSMGGSSGPLIASFFLRAASCVQKMLNAASPASLIALVLTEGAEAISTLGRSKAGDRTLLDALIPAAQCASEVIAVSHDVTALQLLVKVLEAAQKGAESTNQMMPKRGRSTYLGERALGAVDPGAHFVAILMKELVELTVSL